MLGLTGYWKFTQRKREGLYNLFSRKLEEIGVNSFCVACDFFKSKGAA